MSNRMREAWGPACQVPLTTIELQPGVRVTIHVMTQIAWRAIVDVMDRYDYKLRALDTGGFNCRKIGGSASWSLHAYGIAVDFNWQSNPQRFDGKLVTDMPPEMVKDILAIETMEGKKVFIWGGNFRNPDAMHYELAVTPEELLKGIRVAEVAVPTPPPPSPAVRRPLLRRGSKGTAVRDLQGLLVITGHMTQAQVNTGPGVFGPRTERAVREFQEKYRLVVDGVVGPNTWAALMENR